MRSPNDMKWHGDIAHVGSVFQRAREIRGLYQKTVASLCGVNRSTINRFENTGNTSDKTFKAYVAALCRPEANPPLTERQTAFLLRLQEPSRRRDEYDKHLATLSFDMIRSPDCPESLRELVARLRREKRPAFIVDPLYCMHVANETMLQLFGVAPQSLILRDWEMWHSIAAKFKPGSPVRAAQPDWDGYFPRTMAFYFMERQVVPFLFTRRMQAVIQRLGSYNTQDGRSFRSWWAQLKGLGIEFDTSQLPRTLLFQGRTLRVHAEVIHELPLYPGSPVRFVLGGWNPDSRDEHACEVFDQLARESAGADLVFAKDHDLDHSNHVNTWPEVRDVAAT